MLTIHVFNNVRICKMSYCEVTMVSATGSMNSRKTEVDDSQFLNQSLRDSIERSLDGNISKFDVMEQSGLLGNCRTRSNKATFGEIFRSLLLYILDSFNIYRHDVSDKLVRYFHVTPESVNADKKTWVATTGINSQITIEQTGSNKFTVTERCRENNGNSNQLKNNTRVRIFSGRNVEEFIQLLSQHDKLEREQFSELTIAANALKKELVSNYITGNNVYKTQAESPLTNALQKQTQLIPDDFLYQSAITKLSVDKGEFGSLLGDAKRQVGEGSSHISCCGVKINRTIHKLLKEKTSALAERQDAHKINLDELFNDIIFTPAQCDLVRKSLEDEHVNKAKIASIVSCLSSVSGISNLYYACSQAFHVAHDGKDINVSQAGSSLYSIISDNPIFCALGGRMNLLFADFSEYAFKQTYHVVKAVVNEAKSDFDIANFIYTTSGELPEKDTYKKYTYKKYNYKEDTYKKDTNYEYSAESYSSADFEDNYWMPEKYNDIITKNFSGNITIAIIK
ncbi:hypothetical protein ACWA3Y_18205 [Escherichia coli]